MRTLLNSKLGSIIYMCCSLFLSVILFSAGLGAVQVIESSFLTFLLCETMAFKFFWDGLIEFNNYCEIHEDNLNID